MRCDLHVHTVHSGMSTMPVLRHFCRECYSEPEAVYEKLKRSEMDLVTITDHDSIDVLGDLGHHPDFFLSEEVTCTMPSETEVHLGVYDINERQHIEIQRRRNDLPHLLAYLKEQDILFSLRIPDYDVRPRQRELVPKAQIAAIDIVYCRRSILMKRVQGLLNLETILTSAVYGKVGTR